MNTSSLHSALFDESLTSGGERDLDKLPQLNTLCINCSAPLDSSSVRCLGCGHRHRMTSCRCCGEPVFKHGATCVIKKTWRKLSTQGSLVHKLFRWLRQPKYQETFYFHPDCVDLNPDLLSGASSVTKAKDEFLQPNSVARLQRKSKRSLQGETTLKLLGGLDLQTSISPEASPIDRPEMNSVDEFEPVSKPVDPFMAYFEDTCGGLPDVLATYQSGARDFSKAELGGLSLDGHSLCGMNLCRADLRRSCWKNVDLPDVDMSGAIADYSRFENINVLEGLFRKSSFRDVTCILSNLSQADFYKSDLRRSDFYSSNLHRATLTLANFTEAKLDSTDLSMACLLFTMLSQASLMDANLEGATLEQADFSSANLSWCSLKDAVASKVNLSDAVLQHADLEGADLSEAQLLGTDFLNSNLDAALSLQGATYNDLTRFPEGFQFEGTGMIKV